MNKIIPIIIIIYFYIDIPCFIENEILNDNNLLECSFGFLFISVMYFIVKF